MKKNVIFDGVITPCRWDNKSGSIVQYSLQSYDEKEYILTEKSNKINLSSFLNLPVQIKGEFKRNEKDKNTIVVHSCRKIDNRK